MVQQDVEQFNARTGRYDQSVVGRRFHRPIQQAVPQIAARLTREPRAILDVGGSTGSEPRLAAARFLAARLCGVVAAAGWTSHLWQTP